MWNQKNDINELIYKIQTDSYTYRMNLWLPREKNGGRDKFGVWD